VRVAGAEELPFDDGSFTVIWSVASMHHWDDRDRGLADLVRTLAPGGRLLIAEKALKRPGHGITEQQARAVTALLKRLGQVEVRTVGKRVGALRLTIIESTRPGDAGDGAAAAAPDGPAAD
jgi:ubiquinone/menaquinone biosynthesis C-methylase UbiE